MYQGDFLNTVEERLSRMSALQCRRVIDKLAHRCKASERIAFLDMLEIEERKADPSARLPIDDNHRAGLTCANEKALFCSRIAKLMKDVQLFIKHAEDGLFAGYDDEDDGYTVQQEVLLMLQRAQSLALEGYPESSVEVFNLLMPVLASDDVQFSFEAELESLLVEIAPFHLHLLVLLQDPVEACPAIRQMMAVHASLVGWSFLGLEAICRSGRMPLEQWYRFLDAFLEYLSGQEDAISGQLLREGMLMRDGMDALLAHVRSLGASNPEAWGETLQVMVEQNVPGERVALYCLEMLAVYGLPATELPAEGIEPRIATQLLSAARHLAMQDTDMAAWRAIGLHAQVDSDPSPLHLSAWMHVEKQNGQLVSEMAEGLLRHPAIQMGRQTAGDTGFNNASQTIVRFCHMLCRRPIDLQISMEQCLPYGWSDGNAASFHFTWSLVFLLAKQYPEKTLEQVRDEHPCIRHFWDAMIAALCQTTTISYQATRFFDVLGRFQKESPDVASWKNVQRQQMECLLFEAMRMQPKDDNVSAALESWLQTMMQERVAFILKNKFRGAYDRVAKMCVAFAVLISALHGIERGRAVLESIRKTNVRFSAFTSALKREASTCMNW